LQKFYLRALKLLQSASSESTAQDGNLFEDLLPILCLLDPLGKAAGSRFVLENRCGLLREPFPQGRLHIAFDEVEMIAIRGPQKLAAAGNLRPQWQMEIPIGGGRSRTATNLSSMPILAIPTEGTGYSSGIEEPCLSIYLGLDRGTLMTVGTPCVDEREKISGEETRIAVSVCHHCTSLRKGIEDAPVRLMPTYHLSVVLFNLSLV
jgi:hypothetical protein